MSAPAKHLTADEFEAAADRPSSPEGITFGGVLERRLARRDILRGALATTALTLAGPLATGVVGEARAQTAPGGAAPGKASFSFTEIAHGFDQTHHVAPGYSADVLIRWGDPIFADAPEFDAYAQTAAKQLRQFGYNCDYTALLPHPDAPDAKNRGLLWVNHEYTNTEMMFPGVVPKGMDRIPEQDATRLITKDLAEIEMAAHGGSIVEVRRGGDGKWSVVRDSRFNRRITALETAMGFTGPAAGHPRMRTSADPTGTKVIGMLNNCAGGVTPWGTILTCEENIDGYFIGRVDQSHPEQRTMDRYTVPSSRYVWGAYDPRFDVGKEPYESNRFGWVVEIDPADPSSTPRKHTALGRFKHEGCGVIVNRDGRVVVYMGDDQQFEHVYRFVSAGTFKPGDKAANMRLLEEGTLSVARYDEDGSVTWLPLVHGRSGLTEQAGFRDQGDVMINARHAATVLGATRMDRPEDVEVNPKTGKVYVMLTNNVSRRPVALEHPAPAHVNAANPRPFNAWGHIVEMVPPDGDHTAATYRWDILVRAGNPADPRTGASFGPATSANGWFSCPDNCAVDGRGRLWIATDQGHSWPEVSGTADGLWAMETEGPLRGSSQMFFRAPIGAELCGPFFGPDDESLFVAVQHPGVDGVALFLKGGDRSTFENPGTRWPDFDDKVPPRPSVVVVTKTGGGPIGV